MTRRDLYRGVDLVVYGNGEDLEYDLIVQPEADPREISFRIFGARVDLREDGRLQSGPIVQRKPEAYQVAGGRRVRVECDFRMRADGSIGFEVGAYRKDLPLVIDPVVESLARIGGLGEETLFGGGAVYSFGLTRSGDWSAAPGDAGTDVFVRCESAGVGTTTVFWGGAGDEQIGGWLALPEGALSIVGWTNSRSLRVTRTGGPGSVYGGGETDGFLLTFEGCRVNTARYVGGPGADRLHAVSAVGRPPFLVAGETDDAAWPDTLVTRHGPGGGTDALIARLDASGGITAVVAGGSGEDSARGLIQRTGTLRWFVAGETTSPDFPAPAGGGRAGGRDLWIGEGGSVHSPLLSRVTLWGGSGDEYLRGAASTGDGEFHLAGDTSSTDLPLVNEAHGGGASDLFLARVSTASLLPTDVTLVGGEGADHVHSLRVFEGDLLVAASTDSPVLALPTKGGGLDPLGGVDGLFLHCDAFTRPMFAYRVGGAGTDRLASVEGVALGSVVLGGTSDSQEWLAGAATRIGEGGGQDGFRLRLQFAAVAVRSWTGGGLPGRASEARFRVGRDLHQVVEVTTAGESDWDGFVMARSSDPSGLLVSEDSARPGLPQLVIGSRSTTPVYVTFSALRGEGEAEVVLTGRDGVYPQRRVRVALLPSAAFFGPPSDVWATAGTEFPVRVYVAPVDSTGAPVARNHGVRAGVSWRATVTTSDPSSVGEIAGRAPRSISASEWELSLRMVRGGEYVLALQSSGIPAAPNQVVTVRTPPEGIFSRFTRGAFYLVREHSSDFRVEGLRGDSYTVTSLDPGSVQVQGEGTGWSNHVAFTSSTSIATIRISALRGAGEAAVLVERNSNGVREQATMRFRLLDYRWTPEILMPLEMIEGGSASMRFRLEPLRPENVAGVYGEVGFALRPDAAVLGARPTVSDPAVATHAGASSTDGGLLVSFRAGKSGTALVSFDAGSYPEFAGFSLTIKVAARGLVFPMQEYTLVEETNYRLPQPLAYLSREQARVRVRVSEGAPYELEAWPERGKDIIYDLQGNYALQVRALGKAGGKGFLIFSPPGAAEVQLGLRTVTGIWMPSRDETEVRLDTGGQGIIHYQLHAYTGARPLIEEVVWYAGTYQSYARRRAAVVASPEGICAMPAEVDTQGPNVELPVRCSRPGTVEVRLRALEGLAGEQSEVVARIVVKAAAPRPFFSGRSIVTGNGVQAVLSLYGSGTPFRGRIRSTDPSRVLLARGASEPGRESVETVNAGEVYVQGLASEGTVRLIAEPVEGDAETITVHLFPATVVLRAGSGGWGAFPGRDTWEHPRSVRSLVLRAIPALVDAGSGLVLQSAVEGTALLRFRAGMSPAFLPLTSSDPGVAQPPGAGVLVGEGVESPSAEFRIGSAGGATLSVQQPPGFVESGESALKLRVYERELSLGQDRLLGRDLQMALPVRSVWDAGQGYVGGEEAVTVTSLDPSRLLISSSASTPGQAAVTQSGQQQFHLQAQSAVMPGERARVRISAPGYQDSEEEIEFGAVELRGDHREEAPVAMSERESFLSFTLGVQSPFGSQLSYPRQVRPGVAVVVRAKIDDPDMAVLLSEEIRLDHTSPSAVVRLRALRPGRTVLRLEAPEGILNPRPALPVRIHPWVFSVSPSHASAQLVNPVRIFNPSPQQVEATITSTGPAGVLIGTAAAGPNAPRSQTLSVSLAPRTQNEVFIEPLGRGQGKLTVSATHFADADLSVYAEAPSADLRPASPITTALTAKTVSLSLSLGPGGGSTVTLPLGTAAGPLRFEVISSDPLTVRPPSTPLEIQPGESTKNFTVELLRAGAAVISLRPSSGFSLFRTPDVLITVR